MGEAETGRRRVSACCCIMRSTARLLLHGIGSLRSVECLEFPVV
jgi:hypothetical protein